MKYRFFRSACLALLGVICVSAAQAQKMETIDIPTINLNAPALSMTAPEPPSDIPRIATAQDVAMIYYALVHQAPDFIAMVRRMKEYEALKDLDKEKFETTKASELRSRLAAVDFAKPLVIMLPEAQLSKYSEKNRGFVVSGLDDLPYFKFDFGGERFAIIPQGLSDHEFIGPFASNEQAASLRKRQADGHAYNMMLFLNPNFADPPKKLTEIDGENYHVLSGPVSYVALFDLKEGKSLWTDKGGESAEDNSNQLLNLKQ